MAYLTMSRYPSGRKVGPLCETVGRINKQQMGLLYRSTWIQDTIQGYSPSFINSDKSELIFFPVTVRNHRASPETGSGKGTRSGNFRFLFPVIPCTKKEQKVTHGNRSFTIKSVHHETTLQNGDSLSSDIVPRLDCLHRPDRCVPTCSVSSLIQKVSSVH